MTITTDLSLEWILSTIGVSFAFAIGLWRHQRARRHEKIALLLPLISEFESDEELQAARHIVDYDRGAFTLRGQNFSFTNEDLLKTLEVVNVDDGWTPSQAALRTTLDHFFDFFEKLWTFVDIRLLDFEDIRFFYYYFELVGACDKYKNPEIKKALEQYVIAYHFHGVQKCVERYLRLPDSKRVQLQLPSGK